MNHQTKETFGLRPATLQEIALELVRAACPELMELSRGCKFYDPKNEGIGLYVTKVINSYSRGLTYTNVCYVSSLAKEEPKIVGIGYFEDNYKIIGHQPELQHWTRLLGLKSNGVLWNGQKHLMTLADGGCLFFTEDGQPATEEDYKAIVDICS